MDYSYLPYLVILILAIVISLITKGGEKSGRGFSSGSAGPGEGGRSAFGPGRDSGRRGESRGGEVEFEGGYSAHGAKGESEIKLQDELEPSFIRRFERADGRYPLAEGVYGALNLFFCPRCETAQKVQTLDHGPFTCVQCGGKFRVH